MALPSTKLLNATRQSPVAGFDLETVLDVTSKNDGRLRRRIRKWCRRLSGFKKVGEVLCEDGEGEEPMRV
jgi:hypothetical protein